VRTVGAAAAAVLALAGLSGCKTNVGMAAVIDGHRVTESDVSKYLTGDAQPVTQQDSNGVTTQVSPRSFVVNTLINERLGFKLLRVIPSISDTTEAQLDAQLQADLEGKTPAEIAEQIGLHGYTEDFAKLYLRVRELIILVQQQPQGVVQDAFGKVKFPVSVSPRYGKWDTDNLVFVPGARIPGYLDVQDGAVAVQGNN
jgi:hypothetical protein